MLRKGQKKLHWTQTEHGRAFMRRTAKQRFAGRRAKVVKILDAIPVEPVDPIDRDYIEHIANGVWRSLSLADKAKALNSLFFDPSNPNDE